MRPAWPLWILIFVLTGLFAGTVWLTYHPRHPVLDAMASWPVVGGVARALQRTYDPPEPATPEPAPSESAPSATLDTPRRRHDLSSQEPAVRARQDRETAATAPSETLPPSAERPSWMVPEGVVGFEWLRPGTVLRREAATGAEAVATLEALACLTVLERAGDEWARVRLGTTEGWVHLNDASVATEPPLGRAAKAVTGLPGRPPDAERMRRARSLMPEAEGGARLGPYDLYTDVRDAALLSSLDAVATGLEDAYRRRYGLVPVGSAQGTVVLFRRAEAYREFQAGESALAGLEPQGHAGHGLAVLYAGDLEFEELRSTLIHELTHLLNRRAVGPALPPWLDEGLAEDLAHTAVAVGGGLRLGELDGGRHRSGSRVVLTRGYAALQLLARDRAPMPARRLLDLEFETFTGVEAQTATYAQSGLFVRYLLAPESGLARGFQAFLAAVAAGEHLDDELLARSLGRSWEEIDAGFRSWLEGEARRYLGSA